MSVSVMPGGGYFSTSQKLREYRWGGGVGGGGQRVDTGGEGVTSRPSKSCKYRGNPKWGQGLTQAGRRHRAEAAQSYGEAESEI